jgi:hypothetical protein
MLIISAKELHIVRMSWITFPSWNMVCVNFASFTAYNLASDPLIYIFSPTVWEQIVHIVFWFVCCQCEMVWLIDWLVFSVQRAIFQLYSGNSLVMFCITFVISCSGSHAKTSYYWQLISDAVIVGLLHIRAGGRYNPSNVSWSSYWSSVLL